MNRTWLLLALPALTLAACGGKTISSPLTQDRQPEATVSITRVTRTPSPSPTPPPQLCLVTRERGVSETYVPKDLVTLIGGGHYQWTDSVPEQDSLGRPVVDAMARDEQHDRSRHFVAAFLHFYVEGDRRYESDLFGAGAALPDVRMAFER